MNFDKIVVALIAGDITEELLETLRTMSIDDLKRIETLALQAQPHPYQMENVLKVLMHCGYYDGAKYPVVIGETFEESYYDEVVGNYFLVDGKIYTNGDYDNIKAVLSTLPNLRTKTHLLTWIHGPIYMDGVRYSYKKCAGVDIIVTDFNPEQLKPENIFKTIQCMEYPQRLILQSSHLKELKEYYRVMTSHYYSIKDIVEKVNYILSVDNFERYPFSATLLTTAKAVKAIKEASGIEKTRLGLAMSDEDLEKYKPYIQDDEFIAKVQLFKKYRAILGVDLGIFCKVFAPDSTKVETTSTST